MSFRRTYFSHIGVVNTYNTSGHYHTKTDFCTSLPCFYEQISRCILQKSLAARLWRRVQRVEQIAHQVERECFVWHGSLIYLRILNISIKVHDVTSYRFKYHLEVWLYHTESWIESWAWAPARKRCSVTMGQLRREPGDVLPWIVQDPSHLEW